MELATARQLADLNRRFYEAHAVAFAESRPRLHPGVRRVLGLIPPGARVLELGCGDGKVGRWLAANAALAAYLGLDSSQAMLDRAREGSGMGVTFALADLTSPDWPQVLPPAPFDWILAFAVFHHLPGFEARARLLRQLAGHLTARGTLVMSNWQFTRSDRLQKRIVPWPEVNLNDSDVEQNDFLLSWEREGRRGLRYVHVLDESEARQMAEGAGLAVVEVFRSDGVSGELADYVRMTKSG